MMDHSFEIGPIRPPNEGYDCSLLIRATRNCPWNRCLFCPVYKKNKFELRSVENIKKDINAARWIKDRIEANRESDSLCGAKLDSLVREILEDHGHSDSAFEWIVRNNINNVASWLSSGARTVFLQDADSLIVKTPKLVEALQHLKAAFPHLDRCSSYARAKTCFRKTVGELEDLHEAGLSRLHLGLESGNDLVLEFMQKGVTQEQQIAAGKKIVESGISLSEYVMPGLGGRRWSEVHAVDSAKALSEINPDFIRMRSLVITTNSPLYQRYQDGEFEELPEDEVVNEIALFVKNLNCSSYIISDHAANLLPEVEGQLPQDKDRILYEITNYLNRPPMERLKFRLKRRLITYRGIYGSITRELSEKVSSAFNEIEKESLKAEAQTDEAVLSLKRGYI
jgi:radical SAM superfamily enzyme YgiQ (UPF0313 family)